jgi:hypothetical protein
MRIRDPGLNKFGFRIRDKHLRSALLVQLLKHVAIAVDRQRFDAGSVPTLKLGHIEN